MRSVNIAFCALLSIIACEFFFNQKCDAQEEVVIGFNYPKTGPYEDEGLDQLRGAELARDEINSKGGILGRKIRFEIKDTVSNPEIAKGNAEELYDKLGAKMIFGGASSGVAVEVGKVAHQRNRLFFATLSYSMDTTGKDGYRTTFRECYDSWMAARALGEYLLEQGDRFAAAKKKYFYITADYTWGYTTEAALRLHTDTIDTKKHPGITTKFPKKEGDHAATDQDFSDAMLEVRKDAPDVLVLVLFGDDFTKAMHAARRVGISKDIQIIAPNLTLAMAKASGPKNMEWVIGAVPWEWKMGLSFQKGKDFVGKFKKRYENYPPSSSAASAYNILYEYKSAIERVYGIDDKDKDENGIITKQLISVDVNKAFDNTDGIIGMLEDRKYIGMKDEQYWRAIDHQSVQSVFVVQCRSVSEIENSENQLDYFEQVYRLDGESAIIPKELWIFQRLMAGKKSLLNEWEKEHKKTSEGTK